MPSHSLIEIISLPVRPGESRDARMGMLAILVVLAVFVINAVLSPAFAAMPYNIPLFPVLESASIIPIAYQMPSRRPRCGIVSKV